MKEEMYGIITRGVGGLYGIRENGGESDEILCRARGIFRQNQIKPTVGDRVSFSRVRDTDNDWYDPDSESNGRERSNQKKKDIRVDYVIDEILDRRNLLIRPPVANLDYLFAVIPAASPAPDLITADKLTVIAENYGIETVIIVNKSDLDKASADMLEETYSLAGYRVFKVSAENGDGMDKLSAFVNGLGHGSSTNSVTGAFAGVSGGGKSTIMTSLFPSLELKTGGVSRKTERGRHTTRHVELYPQKTDSGIFLLADTPGFSMLDFTRFNFFPYDELAGSFREFGDCLGNCKYTKCTHLREEGCAVIDKLNNGMIAKSRHESYIRIFEEQRSVPEWKRR